MEGLSAASSGVSEFVPFNGPMRRDVMRWSAGLLIMVFGFLIAWPSWDAHGPLDWKTHGVRMHGDIEERLPRSDIPRPPQTTILLLLLISIVAWRVTRRPLDHCPSCGIRRLQPGVCRACGEAGRLGPQPHRRFRGILGRLSVRHPRKAALSATLVLVGLVLVGAGATDRLRNRWLPAVITAVLTAPILLAAGIQSARSPRCRTCGAMPADDRHPVCRWCGAARPHARNVRR